MNSKLLIGFLGGALAAIGVFYVQSHRNAKVEAEPAVAIAPVATPVPEPLLVPETKPVPVKVSAKKVPAMQAVVAKPSIPAAPVEQAKVEAPPAPEPVPAPVVAPPPPPAPIEPKPEPSQPRSVTIPSGTILTVRIGETISTDRERPGDTFPATLDHLLVVDDLVIAD